jgi:beta-N-acetylhexosaminidase
VKKAGAREQARVGCEAQAASFLERRSFFIDPSYVISYKWKSMRLIRLLFLLLFFISLLPSPVDAQSPTPPAVVRVVLNAMTPEEKVGQLFLVSFNGTDAGVDSQIYNLITRYHVGGVMLSSANDNFEAADTLANAHALIDRLQRLEWASSIGTVSPAGQTAFPAYVPLFIGISLEGDGFGDQILNGLTPLPSEMAIGATWNTSFAERMGEVRGRELSALGFNLLLGPSLDILETPSMSGDDLGTRVYGGDPFWVGQMGRAYVSGLQRGSDRNLLVIPKHFPGVGGADRLPEDEVSTVRKSLDQLIGFELLPFLAVTDGSNSAVVDGLLVSHIRYQGFQGSARATTKPLSFDPQALGQILALPQFADWYENGGVLVSDNLGANSVREFYDASGGQFLARVVARDAFLAGNDLLYLGNIKSNDAPDAYATTVRILDFFAQKYREDSAFAQRVDASVARILAAKLRVYGNFIISSVEVPAPQVGEFGNGAEVTFAVASNAATLISPERQDLSSVLPLPPQSSEHVTFITDSISTRQCSVCPLQPLLGVDALENAVLQLYGPGSGGQVEGYRLESFSFQNLQTLLDSPADNEFMEEELKRASWIVLSIADASQGQPALVSRFLRERPDLVRDRRVILFSFGAPYYFDTTTISRFTAYYALYSRQPQFVDVAARLLFQELTPLGASPVSIYAAGYDLPFVLSPNPSQIIPLNLDLPPAQPPGPFLTPEPTPVPLFRIGDTIAIRTGTIRDHNGNPVPDGTAVQFSMVLTGEGGGILQQVEAFTTQGVARASFGLDKPGLLEIRVTSEPAMISTVLQLDVSQSGAVAVTVVVPQLTPSVEATPEPTEEEFESVYISPNGYPRVSAWLVAMLMVFASAGVGHAVLVRIASRTSALRLSLGLLIGGLLAYNLLSFGMFGVGTWLANAGLPGVVLFTLSGELLGFLGGWLWSRR